MQGIAVHRRPDTARHHDGEQVAVIGRQIGAKRGDGAGGQRRASQKHYELIFRRGRVHQKQRPQSPARSAEQRGGDRPRGPAAPIFDRGFDLQIGPDQNQPRHRAHGQQQHENGCHAQADGVFIEQHSRQDRGCDHATHRSRGGVTVEACDLLRAQFVQTVRRHGHFRHIKIPRGRGRAGRASVTPLTG
jgi:hypothetical protein